VTPRKYNPATRLRHQAERKARIAAATADLHSAQGVAATSYAEIAARAGVSLPTVYSHFPKRDDLLQSCTSHVAAQAPPLQAESILAADDLPSAAQRLVAAMERQHLHFEPWLSRREDGVIPFLADMAAGMRRAQCEFVGQLLERHLGPGKRPETIAGWESLLSFDMWHRLVRGHGLSRAAARRIILQGLLALTGDRPTTGPVPPTRRKPS
jgi:AcrR family transcriptional regulator